MRLERYTPPPPPPPPVCPGCRCYAPQCMVPIGDGARAMCWLCAHYVTDHDTSIDDILPAFDRGPCGCTRDQIYPADVLRERDAARDDAAGLVAPQAPEPEPYGVKRVVVGAGRDRALVSVETRDDADAARRRARVAR